MFSVSETVPGIIRSVGDYGILSATPILRGTRVFRALRRANGQASLSKHYSGKDED